MKLNEIEYNLNLVGQWLGNNAKYLYITKKRVY